MRQNIKTVVCALALLVSYAGVSRASTEFRWLGAAGSVRNRHGINIAVSNATILTFISTNSIVDTVAVDTVALKGQLVLDRLVGDDWFYRALPNGFVGLYATATMHEPGTQLVGLYAYAVVLDRPFSQFTTFEAIPRDGTVRAAVSLMGWQSGQPNPTAIWNTVPPPAQSFNGGAVQTTLLVVSEPMGGLLMLMY